jgi:sulfur transfer protein SufE
VTGLAPQRRSNHRVPRPSFVGDSDAHIVRRLIAILFALYSGKARYILDIDAPACSAACISRNI